MQNLRVRKQFHAKMENPLLMLWILVQAKIEELSHVFF